MHAFKAICMHIYFAYDKHAFLIKSDHAPTSVHTVVWFWWGTVKCFRPFIYI